MLGSLIVSKFDRTRLFKVVGGLLIALLLSSMLSSCKEKRPASSEISRSDLEAVVKSLERQTDVAVVELREAQRNFLAHKWRGEAVAYWLAFNLQNLPPDAVLSLRQKDAGTHFESELILANIKEFWWNGAASEARAALIAVDKGADGVDVSVRLYDHLGADEAVIKGKQEPKRIISLGSAFRMEWWALGTRLGDKEEAKFVNWDSKHGIPKMLELDLIVAPDDSPLRLFMPVGEQSLK